MYMCDRTFRAIVLSLLAVACAVVAAFPADAQSNAAKSKASTLPEPLTQEAVRELVARQSDEQVRQLLIAQLDRAAAAPAKAKGDMGMSKMVETNAGIVRERLGDLRDAFVALPATLRQVVANLDDPEGTSALPRAGGCAVGGFGGRLAGGAHIPSRSPQLPQDLGAAGGGDLHGAFLSPGHRSRPRPRWDRRVCACRSRAVPGAVAGTRPAADRNPGGADLGGRGPGHVADRRLPAFEPRCGTAAVAVCRRPCASAALVRGTACRALGPRQLSERGINGRRRECGDGRSLYHL